MPDFITKKKNSIICFEKDPKHSKVYNDNLCLFRCLTYHETKSYGLAFEERVKKILTFGVNFCMKMICAILEMMVLRNFKGLIEN